MMFVPSLTQWVTSQVAIGHDGIVNLFLFPQGKNDDSHRQWLSAPRGPYIAPAAENRPGSGVPSVSDPFGL